MFSVEPGWVGELSDYITAIIWLSNDSLVVSSAAGEVAILSLSEGLQWLQQATGQSVNGLAVSSDGRFIAIGGQDGTVKIWGVNNYQPELLTSLQHSSVWVDRLAWSPTTQQLAFGLGRSVQVWNANTTAIETTLDFASSSVLNLAWHPTGEWLAVCGHHGAKVWTATNWDTDPQVLTIPSASVAIAWSPDGAYLADGNLDNTLTVIEWANPHQPWVMQGFPGKVRQLAWSNGAIETGSLLLACCSSEAIVVWQRHGDDSVGWANRMLEGHEGIVQAIAFHPQIFLLASVALDGWLCLWQNAEQLIQVLGGVKNGFSCLSWHPQGQWLAAGGRQGEVLIWNLS